MAALELSSCLRCPHCGHVELVAMPTDACVLFHRCAGCGSVVRPRAGTCCVFCAYGSVPCPPMQAGSGGCCSPQPMPASDAGSG